jgi:hypothetical protein
MRHDPAAWAAVAAAGALGLLQTLRLWWRSGAAGRKLRLRAARARIAEAKAVRLLEEHGYQVLAEQPTTSWLIGDHEALVRADYLVARGGSRYVAEVKSGEEAPSLASRSTRRQLLEYLCAFDVDDVLLVDAESGSVAKVGFRLPRRQGSRLGIALVAFLAGVIFALFATH